jgi:hypothetical protein
MSPATSRWRSAATPTSPPTAPSAKSPLGRASRWPTCVSAADPFRRVGPAGGMTDASELGGLASAVVSDYFRESARPFAAETSVLLERSDASSSAQRLRTASARA